MAQTIHSNALIQQLIRGKKLEIIGEMKRDLLKQAVQEKMDRKIQLDQVEDAKLSNMIIDGKVDDFDGGTGVGDHDIAETIDMTGEVQSGRRETTMSDIMSKING